jgi:hypothetical protein
MTRTRSEHLASYSDQVASAKAQAPISPSVETAPFTVDEVRRLIGFGGALVARCMCASSSAGRLTA